MADIFVSYKAEDRRRVKLLVDALAAEGFSVWWDEQIGGGTSWRQAIEAELNAAKCVIVAWSKRSVGPKGGFVQDEATRAQQRQVYVPVTIDKVHLPLGFGETQALPLVGWQGDCSDSRYQAVLSAVRRNVGGKRRPSNPAVRQAGVDRRAILAGGTVAVAIAGVAGWELLKHASPDASSNSVAVLPFANLSGDPRQSYFSDGIAEEIRTALARLRGVTVIGRTSSEAVRNEDARGVARKLGVGRILTGSVRQSASTIRITAELIDGSTGADQWSQDYDRSPGDAIKIQTDIAENVARALSVALGTVARAAISAGGTQNAGAQNLVLQAQSLATMDTRNSLTQAQSLLNRAIEIDPGYADAYARAALVLARLAGVYASNFDQLSTGLKEALRLASKAVSLAPGFETGHRALANVYAVSLEIPRALSEAERALELAPSNPDALRYYSKLQSYLGRSSEAIRACDKVVAIDPLNPASYSNQVEILYNARRYADAIATSQRITSTSTVPFNWQIALAGCLLEAGRLDDARRMYAAGEADHPFRLAGEAVLATRQGDKATALARFNRLKQLYGDAENYQYAQIHAQTGDHEQAFRDLQRAWQVRDPGLQFLRGDPWLDPLRSDPRFGAILRELKFHS